LVTCLGGKRKRSRNKTSWGELTKTDEPSVKSTVPPQLYPLRREKGKSSGLNSNIKDGVSKKWNKGRTYGPAGPGERNLDKIVWKNPSSWEQEVGSV